MGGWSTLEIPWYDRTLNNCPECGSNDISHTYSIPIKPTNEQPKKPVENVDGVVLSQSIDLNY